MSKTMSTTTTTDGRMGRFAQFMEGRVPHRAQVKRFDGAMRTSSAWDNLRRVSCLLAPIGKNSIGIEWLRTSVDPVAG